MKAAEKKKKIIFATKFHEMAFNSLKTLFPLGAAGFGEIILCHVIRREDVGFVPFGGYLREEEQKLRNEALIRFEDWQGAISEAGLQSRAVVEVGEPVHSILELARKERAGLLVIGKKKVSLMERAFPLGSDTLEILRRSPVPVLVSRYYVEYEWEGERAVRTNEAIFEKPLLAADWSAASEEALSFLISLGAAVKRAAVVHILGEKEMKGEDFALVKEDRKIKLQGYCERLKASGMEAGAHLLSGEPAEGILEAARETGASMIIAGTTEKDRFREFFLGSVSHKITGISEFPVLLVPVYKGARE
ncbi:MAG: universal stress protein [Nitrospiraceae bacterium]|nr:universal stress protein [Nitrospiraceae bacterium]